MPANRVLISPTAPHGVWTVGLFLPLVAVALGLLCRTIPYSPHSPSLREWAVIGLAGIIPGLLYGHRYRGVGFVPFALTGAAVAGTWAAFDGWCPVTAAVASGCLGIAFTRLLLALTYYHRGTVRLVWILLASVVCLYLGAGEVPLDSSPRKGGPPPIPVAWFAGVTSAAAVFAWWWLFRAAFELACAPVMWLMFKLRVAGPGRAQIPARGPCVVVANHACWFDPHFLALVFPRPVTPMMTSAFYDVPGLRWLMVRLGVIRVPQQGSAQEVAAVLEQAVAALDRGECVVIFPEGHLRHSEDRPLKRFGRGVWQILAARPETPVFACWIEGGWGSYTSYCNGPPTKNKRMDVRRRIGVAVSDPVVLDADTLKHHLRTRLALMNRVAAARTHLGLPELPAFELPVAGKGEE